MTLWSVFHPVGFLVSFACVGYFRAYDVPLVPASLLTIAAVVAVRSVLYLVTGGSKWA